MAHWWTLRQWTRRRRGACVAYFAVPLVEDVVVTNKVSQNLHAELLLHQTGSAERVRDGSTAEGARVVRAFLERCGSG